MSKPVPTITSHRLSGQLHKWKVESSAFNFKGGNGCSEVMLEMREKSLRYKEEASTRRKLNLMKR